MPKKISPKLEQATEKYLNSFDSSKDCLTNEQWNIVANSVKTQRMRPATFLLVGGLICAIFSFVWFQQSKKLISPILSNNLEKIILVTNTNGELSNTTYEAAHVQVYLKHIAECSSKAGMQFAFVVFCFTGIFITIPLSRRANRKMFAAFVPRKPETLSNNSTLQQ